MRKDTVIAGIVLVVFGISGLVYGISNFGNPFGPVQNCSPSSTSPNQSSFQSIPAADCENNPARLVIGSVASVIGVALLIVGAVLMVKGARQKREMN